MDNYKRSSKNLSVLLSLSLLWFATSIYAQPDPGVTLDVPANPFIGENFTFSVSFDNEAPAPGNVGYGPYLDLVLPANGADGAAGTDTPDGYSFAGATYLGAPVTAFTLNFPSGPLGQAPCSAGQSSVQHPLAFDNSGTPLVICGTPADQLVVLQLPFGSFVPDQPIADIQVSVAGSDLADLNTALPFFARAGFQFGADPLDNPVADPSISDPIDADSTNWPTATATPTLITLSKVYLTPETETATGPNFPRQMQIRVNVADGQTVTDLDVFDDLPDNLVITAVTPISPTGNVVTPAAFPFGPVNNGVVQVNFPSVNGTNPVFDAEYLIDFYVPQFDANGLFVNPFDSGDDNISANNASALGDWTPVDIRDSGATDNASADPAGIEDTLDDQSIAIQKSVVIVNDTGAVGPSPGDTLQYTLNFQISDFFAFDNVVINDEISDGQRLDRDFIPTLQMTELTNSVGPIAFIGASAGTSPLIGNNFTELQFFSGGTPGLPSPVGVDDGDTVMDFRLSAELATTALGSVLQGGCVPPGGTGTTADADVDFFPCLNGGTSGQIVYQTIIQDNFSDDFPSGDPSVDQGDTLNNEVVIDGDVVQINDLSTLSGQTEDDDSGAEVTIAFGTLDKSIYAINGSTAFPSPVEVQPGDTVTYRIQYTLPSSDFEQLRLIDFLPLPVFDATEINNVPPGTFQNVVDATAPAAGTAKYGPGLNPPPLRDIANNPASAAIPIITTDAAANSVTFDYSDHDDTLNRESQIDLLFTVTVSDEPFADNLFLTNQVRAEENTTNSGTQQLDDIIQVRLREPDLVITKGVFSTTGDGTIIPPPPANPAIVNADSNINNADAGDLIEFVITIENQGGAEAFQVNVTDLATPGLSCATDAASLTVQNGNGTPLNVSGDLSTGLAFTDGPDGSLAVNDGSPGAPYGADTALIFLNCTIDATVIPHERIINNASVEWGAGPVPAALFAPISDDATLTMAGPAIIKTIDSVSPAAAAPNVTTGDTVTYSLTVTLPEGTTPDLTLSDTLPAGFQFVAASVTVNTTGFAGTLPVASVTPPGANLLITFPGNTTVTGDNDASNNSFSVNFDALVLDVPVNDGFPAVQAKNNVVRLTYTGITGPVPTDNASINFAEPNLLISKQMTPATGLDAGNTVTVTLTVTNNGTAPVYDVVVSDELNEGANNDLFDLSTVAEGTTDPRFTFAYASPTVTYTMNPAQSIAPGASATFTFTANVSASVVTGSSYNNSAAVTGDTQDGVVNEERTNNNNANTSVDVAPVSVSKALIASSEAWTSDAGTPVVAIGELLTYRVTFDLPEGVIRESAATPIITDTLPAGFQFLAGTATIQAIADNSITAEDLVPGPPAEVIPGIAIPIMPDIVTVGPRQQLQFDIGDISNNDNDADVEQLLLTYQVLVLNTANNNRTNAKANNATLTYLNTAGTAQTAMASFTVNIGEPILNITKNATPAIVDGNDSVTFEVIYRNQNGAQSIRAWEPEVADTLPPQYVAPFALNSVILSRGGVDLSGPGCTSFINGTLDISLNCLTPAERYLDPGDNITVQYSATVISTIGFEQTVTNTADGLATSLPGPNGNGPAPGVSGAVDGERTGDGGVNDLAVMDSASVTADRPTITKESDVSRQIGETTTMTLTIPIPVGTSTNFVVTDNLPAGLFHTGAVFNVSFSGNPGEVTTTNTPAVPAAGSNPLVFDFGDVTNSAADARTLTITYQVRVDNVIANQNNTALTNTATLNFDGIVAPLPSDTATVTVIEPNLQTVKTVTSGATGSDAGDTISYQLVISNSSPVGTAYRVDLRDVLPLDLLGAPDGSGSGPDFFLNIGLSNPAGLIVLNGTATPLAVSDAAFISTAFGNDTLTWPLFDMPPNSTLTITYDAVVANTALAGSVLNNTVTAAYSSLPDGGANARDGSDIGSDDDNDADLNNYNEAATSSITLDASINIQKTLNPATDTTYTIGDLVTYDVRVDVDEGTTNNVVVSDVLPPALSFVAPVTIIADPNISFSGTGTAVEAPAGTLSIDMGNVSNTADSDPANDFFIVRINAQVLDDAGNNQGVLRTNTASVTSDSGDSGPVTADITIVEPNLEVLKVADDVTPSLGDNVTFTISVRHTAASGADAEDVILTDLIPAGLTYLPGSATGPVTFDESNLAQPVFTLGSITLAETQKQFTFQATVDIDAVVDQPITNTIDLDYSAQPGTPPIDRDYTDNGSETVTPSAQAILDASKTVAIVVDGGSPGVANPGDTLEYTIIVRNLGPDPVTNAVFTDTIPANTTYVATSLSSSAGVEDDSGDPNLRVDIGNMAVNDNVIITFRVSIDGGTPSGMVISNQGSVDSNQTVPEPTDQDDFDGNGDQPTDITVDGPAPVTNALYVEKRVQWQIDADSSDSVTPGDTMRYVLVFHNLGDQDLSNVVFDDTIANGLTYVAASATISGANTINVVGGNISISIPTLFVGLREIATFDVTIDGPPLFNTDATPEIETFINQGSASSDQTTAITSDSNGDPSDGNQSTDFTAVDGIAGTPVIDVEKRVNLAIDNDSDGLVDPLDTLTYNIIVQNTGASTATNVRLSDPIPNNTSIVAGSVTTSQGIVLSESPVAVNIGNMFPGTVVTITFRVTVDAGTADGTIISNQASVAGDNFASQPSDDNGSDNDGLNPNLTPVDTDGSNGAGSPSGLNKTLITSSEPDSAASDVLIGEILTFQVAINLPVGTLNEVTMLDTLPAGLSYIAGSSRLARVFDVGLNASQNPAGINATAAGSFVNLADGSELIVNNQDLEVFLGDVINSDNDGNDESYILEFQALVDNIASNQAATTLTNQATVRYQNGLGQQQQLTPVTEAVTVHEPALQIDKTVSPGALLPGGGNVTFTFTITHPSSGFAATGYDVRIVDRLPSQWSGLSIDSITPSAGVSGITDNSAGTTLDISAAVFPPDGQIVIQATASAAALPAGTTIINTATLSWTSLPGTNGTGAVTPGVPGDSDGERTGSSAGPNDYNQSDNASVVVDQVNFSKGLLNAQPRYAIGDIAEYQLEISLPATATLNGSTLQDVLDQGLTYIPASLTIQYPVGVSASNNPGDFNRTDNAPLAGQETLTLDFGTLNNNNGTIQVIVLNYQVRVDNILSNQNGQALVNNADFMFEDPGTGAPVTLSDTTTLIIGEPHLTLDKAITSAAADLDAGDSVSYQISLGNDGTSTAFDVVLSDTLPNGLENITNLRVISVSGGAATPLLNNNGVSWFSDPFSVPVGATVIIGLDAQLSTGVIPGQQIQNQILASFSSQDGVTADERDDTSPNSEQDDDTDLDNYNTSANSPTITVADPVALDKGFHPDPGDNTYTIGEIVNYRLTMFIIEGTLNDLLLTDTLPDGVSFIDATVGVGNAGLTHGFNAPPVQLGQTLSFDFGDVSNPANTVTNDDFISVDIRVRIDDIVANQNATVLSNNASLSFSGPGGTEIRDFDEDAATPGVQPLDLSVVLADLELSKTMLPGSVPLGGEVTVTLVVSHTAASTADAFDIEIVDTLPPGLSYVPDSATITPAVAGQQLTFNIAAVTLLDNQSTISYRATVDLDAAVGVPLINTAQAVYSTLPGDDPNERELSTNQDTAEVTPNANEFIDATKTVTLVSDAAVPNQIDPGDTLEYRIVLTNTGNPVTNVVFSDTIPAQTVYVAGSLSASVGGEDDSGDPLLRVNVGDMATAATVTITFRVTVAAGTASGTIISNQGSVNSDQTVPEPTDQDGVNENGDQPTDVVVGPPTDVLNALYAQKLVQWIVDADNTNSVTPGDTLRYTIILNNIGNDTLTNVSFDDVIPTGLSYLLNSAVSSAGIITVLGDVVTIAIPAIAANSFASASFDVTIDAPLFDGSGDGEATIETFINQGLADSQQTTPVPSDGQGDATDGNQPTVITAVDGAPAQPAIDVEKRAGLFIDLNNNGAADQGDTINYRILIRNSGASPAFNTVLSETVPTGTTFIPGSLTTSIGSIVDGTAPDFIVNIGVLDPGFIAEVRFRVTINPAQEGTVILNQASVSANNFPNTPSDNNNDDGDGLNPTEVPVPGASLGNFVWLDSNGDGLQDAEEPGIAGVTVSLLDSNGALLATTVTDGNGFYEFTELPPGDYEVVFTPPAGLGFTTPETGNDPAYDSNADPVTGSAPVSLAAGEDNPTVDAGLVLLPGTLPLGSIGDFVWSDLNGDGIQDPGEPGIAGITVHLLDDQGNLISTVITDANGHYSFDGLTAGDYQIEFAPGPDYDFSPPAQGTNSAFDSDADPLNGLSGVISLPPGANITTVDAGLLLASGEQPASLGDFVWYDSNGDGIQNPGEPGIPGVVVNLYDDQGNLIATVVTDASGGYQFAGLPPGTYQLEFVPPDPNLQFSFPDQGGDDAADSDADIFSDLSDPITLTAGETNNTIDAGLSLPGVAPLMLSGQVWLDENGNDNNDPGEGIAGVTMVLYDEQGNVIATTITDANGDYNFDGLLPGVYHVEVDTRTLPPDITAQIEDPDNVFDSETTLNLTQDATGIDFGYQLAFFVDADKSVAIAVDNGVPGQVDPGDTLQYTIVLNNINNAVSDVVFTDTIPNQTTYVAGSLNSTVGSSDDSAAPVLQVFVGAMANAASVTISFQVVVNDFVAAGVVISNQGSVDAAETEPEPTDVDSIDENGDQPTDITVGEPLPAALYATKFFTLSNDIVAPSGTINEGDEVTYQIVIRNSGAVAVNNVSFSDNVPSGPDPTGMIVTNISTTQGSAPAASNTILISDIGTIAAGATVTITITGTVQDTGIVMNQGIVNGDEIDPTNTDGNGDPNDGIQVTEFPVEPPGITGQADLVLSKSLQQTGDVNGDGAVNPGEIVRFSIIVLNQGSIAATNVILNDDLSAVNGSLINASVQTSQGVIISETPIVVNLGTLAAGASATVVFEMSAGVSGLLFNQATAADEQGNSAQDDAETTIVEPDVFDPPSGQKVVNDAGLPELEWRMVWLNSGNIIALDVIITDAIPANSTYVTTSLVCEARGASTVNRCEYDTANDQIVYEGNIAADPGASGEEDAVNEVIIVYRSRVLDSSVPVENQASAHWDEDGDGFIGDDVADGQIPVVSDDPGTPQGDDPTIWIPPVVIPTLSARALLLLAGLLGLIARRRFANTVSRKGRASG